MFFFAINMQRMFITAGGVGYHSIEHIATWKPHRLRLVFVVMLALLFAPPLYLLFKHQSSEAGIGARVDVLTARFRAAQMARQGEQGAQLHTHLALLAEKLQLLGVASDVGLMKAGTVPVRRKALAIGVQNYRHVAASPSALSSARDVQTMLGAIGFHVDVLSDPAYDDVLVGIDRYMKSLVPGDISVVYFAGHDSEGAGRHHLMPVDVDAGSQQSTVNLAQLMDDLAARAPRASVLLLDASQPAGQQSPDKPRPTKLPAGTLLLASAPAGASVQPGALTRAMLRHLPRGESIDAVMQKIADDVAPGRNSGASARSPVIISSLRPEYIQLSGRTAAVKPPLRALLEGESGACAQATRPVTVDAVTACLSSSVRMLRTQLAANAAQSSAEVDTRVDAYRGSLMQSGMLRERWELLWSDRWASIGWMIVCVLLLCAGDLVRDASPAALRCYEAERAILARALIEQRFILAREEVCAALQTYASARLPGPRWHEMRSYFDLRAAASPLQRAPFVSHGSAEDLLERLAWQMPEQEATL
jgi:hypothetical protein